MKMKLVAISAGRKFGNNEILLKEAMMAAGEVTIVEPYLIRLSDLNLKPCTGCEGCMKRRLSGQPPECVISTDDYRWLADQMKDADALLFGAPIYDYLPSGNFIVMLNRGLGFGEPSSKTKVCSAISLGGSDWIDFTEPVLDLTLKNFAENAAIIDKLVVGDHPAYEMVLLDENIMNSARNVGKNLAHAYMDQCNTYKGNYGICPVCHCNLLEPVGGKNVMCPYCGASGTIGFLDDELTVSWKEDVYHNNRFSKTGREKHRMDIKARHKWTADHSDLIKEKKQKYADYDPVLRP